MTRQPTVLVWANEVQEPMLFNCGVGEDFWEFLGLQGDPQSILKEISPGCSLEGLMLNMKLQYFGHLMQRADSFEKTHLKRWERLRAGGEGDDRGWDGWMALLTRWTWVWVDSGSWWWTGRPGVLQFMGSQRVGHTEYPCIHCWFRLKLIILKMILNYCRTTISRR